MHGCSAHLQFPLPLCQYGGPSVAMPKQNRIFGDSNRGMPRCPGFGPIFSSQTLSPGSRKNADDENLQRSSTWINPYQEQFLRKQTSDLGKPGGENGDCHFFLKTMVDLILHIPGILMGRQRIQQIFPHITVLCCILFLVYHIVPYKNMGWKT